MASATAVSPEAAWIEGLLQPAENVRYYRVQFDAGRVRLEYYTQLDDSAAAKGAVDTDTQFSVAVLDQQGAVRAEWTQYVSGTQDWDSREFEHVFAKSGEYLLRVSCVCDRPVRYRMSLP